MTDIELDDRIREFQQLKEIYENLEKVIENLKDEIKAEMTRRQVDTLKGLDYKIIWREHTYRRLDKDLLEKDFGDLSKYTKTTTYKSFYLKKI